MKLIDVTLPIRADLPRWPGDPPIELERFLDQAAGDVANASRLAMSVHTGTHVDAPVHFVPGGAAMEAMPLDLLVGPARVLDVGDAREVGPEQLDGLPAGTRRVLLRTRNSRLWDRLDHAFREDFVALTPDGAARLVELGVGLVGIDYLSVQRFADTEPTTHRVLLGAGMVIVEGLDLREAEAGEYELLCLPLKLVGSDGAPARVVLRSRE